MSSTNITSPLITAINSSDHGPRIILGGGIMTGPLILMMVLAFYVRFQAGTVLAIDGILLMIGALLDISVFATYNVLTRQGLGHREQSIDSTTLIFLERLLLGSFMLLFLSHGITKMAYNLLARRTIRSASFKIRLDVFNLLVAVWTLANMIVTAVALGKASAPSRYFFWVSGIVGIGIMIGQFTVWMSIIWRTNTKLAAKVRWTLSIGAFLPACIAATVCRIVYIPHDLFGPDWTFVDSEICTIFLIELNLATMNVLAPNLPTFFQKSSFGGWYFMPGEAIDAASWKSKRASLNPNRPVPPELDDVYKGEHGVATRVEAERDSCFIQEDDSNAIMVRRSIEVRMSPANALIGSE